MLARHQRTARKRAARIESALCVGIIALIAAATGAFGVYAIVNLNTL